MFESVNKKTRQDLMALMKEVEKDLEALDKTLWLQVDEKKHSSGEHRKHLKKKEKGLASHCPQSNVRCISHRACIAYRIS